MVNRTNSKKPTIAHSAIYCFGSSLNKIATIDIKNRYTQIVVIVKITLNIILNTNLIVTNFSVEKIS